MRAPLVVGVLALGGGIAGGLQWPVPSGSGLPYVWLSLAGAAVALVVAWRGRLPVLGADVGRVPFLLMAGAGLLLGMHARTGADRSCARWLPDDLPVDIVGAVVEVSPPRQGASDVRLRIRVDEARVAGVPVACGDELPARLRADAAAGLGAGVSVTGRGRWWSPPGARPLLHRPGTFVLDSLSPAVAASEAAAVAAARTPVGASIRAAGRARVDSIFTRHAPLAASLLLAQRDGLDPDVRDRYARAGLSHLLAISGLHVGLIAGILLLLAGATRTRRGVAAGVAAAGTVGYVAMLGAPHSAVRAALQIVLVLLARAWQRPTRTEALIAAAALALLAVEPGAIVQPGFQLSFAGVAGILALRRPLLARLAPLQRLRLGRRSVGRWLADGVATSLAATLATAPIVAWHFGRVAPIGIVANLIAIPLLGLAVPALALALVVGIGWLPAGRFLAGGGEALLDVLDATASVASSIPYGTVAIAGPRAALWTAAAAVGWVLARRIGRVRWTVRVALGSAAAGAVLAVAPVRPLGDEVEVHVIDVGQGDAIAVRSPAGRWLLVDAGIATGDYDAGERLVVPYLTRRGVRRLEGLVVTHADADHMGGAGSVMARLRPGWVGGPGIAAAKAGYLDLLRAARAAGIPWLAVRRGVELELDGLRVAVLYPGDGDLDVEDANDASVVLLLEYGEFSALLTGDAPAEAERRLVRIYGDGLEAEVLKVGHHGSATSTAEELLRATGSEAALISAGRGNRYGHPHPDVVARLRHHGVPVYRTDRQGSIIVRSGADGVLSIESERER